MAGRRWYPRLGFGLVVTVTLIVVGCAAMRPGGTDTTHLLPPAPAATPAAPAPQAQPIEQLKVLQLNLCNSGIASCYTGRSVAEATEVIKARSPDVVTFNEMCDGDLPVLQAALPGGAAVFRAARNGPTGEDYPCRNGQRYGIGIVSRLPAAAEPLSGIFEAQDPNDPEKRAWLCQDLATTPTVTACTTHLAYTNAGVTSDQCAFLFDSVVADKRRASAAVVVAADLNMRSGRGSRLSACLPEDVNNVDDTGQQHIVSTPDLPIGTSEIIDLDQTDHPGLIATLTPRRGTDG